MTAEDVLRAFAGRPVAELEAEWRKLVERAHSIQTQLGDMNKTVDGKRMGDREYHEWRHRALVALRCINSERRAYKDALKQARRRFNTDTPLRPATELTTAQGLLHAALVTLKRIASEVDVDDDEQLVIDALDRYLREQGRIETPSTLGSPEGT